MRAWRERPCVGEARQERHRRSGNPRVAPARTHAPCAMGLGRVLRRVLSSHSSASLTSPPERRRLGARPPHRAQPSARELQEARVIAAYRGELERLHRSSAERWAAFDAEPDEYRVTLELRELRRRMGAALEAYYAAVGARSPHAIEHVLDAIERGDERLARLDNEILAEVSRFASAADEILQRARTTHLGQRGIVCADADDALIELELYRAGWEKAMDAHMIATLDRAQATLNKVVDGAAVQYRPPPLAPRAASPPPSHPSLLSETPVAAAVIGASPMPDRVRERKSASKRSRESRPRKGVRRKKSVLAVAPVVHGLDEDDGTDVYNGAEGGAPGATSELQRTRSEGAVLHSAPQGAASPRGWRGDRTRFPNRGHGADKRSPQSSDEAPVVADKADLVSQPPSRRRRRQKASPRKMSKSAPLITPSSPANSTAVYPGGGTVGQLGALGSSSSSGGGAGTPNGIENGSSDDSGDEEPMRMVMARNRTLRDMAESARHDGEELAEENAMAAGAAAMYNQQPPSPRLPRTPTALSSSSRPPRAPPSVSRSSSTDHTDHTDRDRPSLDHTPKTSNLAMPQHQSFASTLYHTQNARKESISDAGIMLQRSNVRGDGRCLFRSIARGRAVARGRQIPSERAEREDADNLRERAVAELKRNRELLARFYVIEGNFAQYTKKMSHSRTFGGEPELLMLAKILHTPIAVYILFNDRYRQIQVYGKQYRGDPLRVLYSDGVHFDSLLCSTSS